MKQPKVKWICNYLDEHDIMPEMASAIAGMLEWSATHFSYESKNVRIREWSPSEIDAYDIISHIFACCILHPEGTTYQAMIGYISGNIRCKDPLDRAKCAAEVIAICYQHDLIVITQQSDKTFMITTEFELNEDIPDLVEHRPQFKKPAPVLFNPILGNRFKKHGADICVDHINRMNSIPFTLENRVIADLEETTKAELETDEQVEQWEDFKRRSAQMYDLINQKNNRFYLMHSMDTRGRCYCEGYYVTYQGAQFKKAIVQLADKELVKL